ncbi:hypothetical protein [Pseudomonas aeruginosa]|uniref:hypothetical protein n=1 Tax=Pseudomonas aeruginosa TaxID=287 RepID=UPI0035C19CBE
MTTYATGNPLGSKDPRDLYDNSENLDAAMNDRVNTTWNDRFGVSRKTWFGVEQQVNDFLANSGFELPPLVYVDGSTLTVDRPTQLIERDGNLYSVKLPASFPVQLTGNWSADEPLLTVRSDQSLRQQLAGADGADMVGLIREGTTPQYSTTVYDWYQTTMINAVTDYGMVPDFDPQPGTVNGTNNLVAIQRLMDDLALMPGRKVVVFPAGNYYFNWDGTSNVGGVGVLWGRVGAGLSNVTFFGYGATFYGGSAGRFNGIFSANRGVNIKGLRVIGYTGGVISSGRQNDACFTCNYNCYGVTFEEVYMSNSLGDCLYIGGSLVSGGETGYGSRDIVVRNCVLKERYGNGIRSYNGGTRSRLAIALIDCVGFDIIGGRIYGEVDLEPNLNGQNIQSIFINNVKFPSGNVVPYTGSNPFYDEPIGGGGQVIRGGILLQSRASVLTTAAIEINGVMMDYGRIRLTQIALEDTVVKNCRFRRGLIQVGHDSGTGENRGAKLFNVHADLAFNGSDDDIDEVRGTGKTPATVPSVFIMLQGMLTYAHFRGVTAGRSSGDFSYLIYADPARSAGDGGRCTFSDCYVAGATISNFKFSSSTEVLGMTSMPSSGIGTSQFNRINSDSISNKIGALSISASGSINWVTNSKRNVDVTATTTGLSITGVANSPEVGSEIRIRNAGSNSFTLASGASFYLKGGANALLDDNRKMVTFEQVSAGVWVESYRNF